MTAKEVFEIITKDAKWYAGYTTPQNASNIKKRFANGNLSFSTLENLFNHFGYYLNASWDKVNNPVFLENRISEPVVFTVLPSLEP